MTLHEFLDCHYGADGDEQLRRRLAAGEEREGPQRMTALHVAAMRRPGPAFERIGLGAASYVAVLAHDPKLDVAALELAARSPARYVGALGSRRTHERRVAAGDGSRR